MVLSQIIELFNPSTVLGSILCGIAATVIVTAFAYTFRKILTKVKGEGFSMTGDMREKKISSEKSGKADTEENKQVKSRDANSFDKIEIKGNITGTVNFGTGNFKINNKK